MITVRVTFWTAILLIILSSLLDVSGDFDLKLTRIEDGNSTIGNAVLEINSEIHKSHKIVIGTGNNDVPAPLQDKNDKQQHEAAEIRSSFGETFSSQTEFKSEITHRKGTNTAPSFSQVDVSNRVSETGQAVVVTLVDSASIELQNRASAERPRSSGGPTNLSDASVGAARVNYSVAAEAPRPALRDKGTGTALPVHTPPPLPSSTPLASSSPSHAPPAPLSPSAQSASSPSAPAAAAVQPPVEEISQPGGAEAAAAPQPHVPAVDATSEFDYAPASTYSAGTFVANASAHAPVPHTANSAGERTPTPGKGDDSVPVANGTSPPQDQQYVVRAEPKDVREVTGAVTTPDSVPDTSVGEVVGRRARTTEAPAIHSERAGNTSTGADTPEIHNTQDTGNVAEDIPSFSEWAQRQLAEAEEKKKVLNASAGGPGGGARSSAAAAAAAATSAVGGAPVASAGTDHSGSASDGKTGGGTLKLRSKNYASPDCGAKIVAANPEGVSAGAVLTSSRDEYMLNTCTTRIWFVVELCEAIQAKKVELANFELFSSSPREFAVSVSDRVQGREWRLVGRFAAADERSVQTFALSPHLFGRYVKVEVLSHHGSEHFCPLSLFRVYGTSEFEVLEKVDQAADDEDGSATGTGSLGLDGEDEDDDGDPSSDDEIMPVGTSPGDPPRNLFESYKNAVLSIVKKAAQALTKSSDGSNETAANATNEDQLAASASHPVSPTPASPAAETATLCKSPRHLVVCDNCSDALYGNVFALLSCREHDLEVLLASGFVVDALRVTGRCARFGLQLASRRPGAPFPLPAAADSARADPGEYFAALFSPEYVAALCNLLAVDDRRVALNVSDQWNETASPIPPPLSPPRAAPPTASPATFPPAKRLLDLGLESALPPVTCTLQSASSSTRPCQGDAPTSCTSIPVQAPPGRDLASQIKPTRTLVKQDGGDDTAAPLGFPLDGSVSPSVSATDKQQPVPATLAQETTAVMAPLIPATTTASAAAILLPVVVDTEVERIELPDSGSVALPPPPPLTEKVEPADTEAVDGIDSPATCTEDGTQENFDSLLRDLKDLDQGEIGGGVSTVSPPPSVNTPSSRSAAAAGTATTMSTTATTISTATPNSPSAAKIPLQTTSQSVQKDSVFVRLANRIKALERNMSLSSQYLEELSRRYKKQVEEMQKAFNRTLQAVHEAGRIGEEQETRRQEEMKQLQQQLALLSESLQNLVGDHNSWLNRLNIIAQHLILICVEILIFLLLMYFCRRLPETGKADEEMTQKSSVGTKGRKGCCTAVKRRRSVDGVSGHESPQTRNRRPSEEANHITGSYQDLLISEPGVSEVDGFINIPKGDTKRRRRRKKDVLLRSASIRLPLKNSEHLMNVVEEQKSIPNRRASSLELGVMWTSSNGVPIDEDEKVEQKSSEVFQQFLLDPLPSDYSTLQVTKSVSPHLGILETDSEQLKYSTQRQVLFCDQAGDSSICKDQIKHRSVSDTVLPLIQNNGRINSNVIDKTIQRELSSPVFMKTATSIRRSRLGSDSVEPSPPAKLKSDNWEWYRTHHGLDKSSQPNKVICSILCPGSGTGNPNQRQNGHSTSDDARRSSNASSNTSNISEQVSRKDSGKKGPSSLKKMVKKFF